MQVGVRLPTAVEAAVLVRGLSPCGRRGGRRSLPYTERGWLQVVVLYGGEGRRFVMRRGVQPERKRIRLPADAYREAGSAWLVTIGTAGRVAVFADVGVGRDVVAVFRDRCRARRVGLDAVCLMPDHAHLLVQIMDGARLVDVVGDLKSNSTRRWWAQGGTGPLWQRSFHDRGLRTARDYERAAVYLLDNPVRAGLVEEWEEYPLIGGTLVDGESD